MKKTENSKEKQKENMQPFRGVNNFPKTNLTLFYAEDVDLKMIVTSCYRLPSYISHKHNVLFSSVCLEIKN